MIEEAEKCLNFLVETADAEAVDLMIIAGDIFDSGDVKLDSKAAKLVIRTFNRLADIAPVAVILGTPSHDGTAAEILSFVRGKYPIHVATRPEQIFLQTLAFVDIEAAVKYGGCDAVISLVPAPTKQYFQGNGDIKQGDAEIAAAMSQIFAGMGATAAGFGVPHILVGHWQTAGSLISETQVLTGVDIEISPDMMMLANPTLCLLGHIHKAQQVKANIFYSGSLFANTWGEMDDKGFWIHEIGDEVVSRFLKTPSRKMVRISLDYLEKIAELTADAETVAGATVRVDVTIWQDLVETVNFEAMKKDLLRWGAESVDIRITRLPRENIRADAVLKAETLRDKLIAAAELRGETVSESILEKADALEHLDADKLIAGIGSI